MLIGRIRDLSSNYQDGWRQREIIVAIGEDGYPEPTNPIELIDSNNRIYNLTFIQGAGVRGYTCLGQAGRLHRWYLDHYSFDVVENANVFFIPIDGDKERQFYIYTEDEFKAYLKKIFTESKFVELLEIIDYLRIYNEHLYPLDLGSIDEVEEKVRTHLGLDEDIDESDDGSNDDNIDAIWEEFLQEIIDEFSQLKPSLCDFTNENKLIWLMSKIYIYNQIDVLKDYFQSGFHYNKIDEIYEYVTDESITNINGILNKNKDPLAGCEVSAVNSLGNGYFEFNVEYKSILEEKLKQLRYIDEQNMNSIKQQINEYDLPSNIEGKLSILMDILSQKNYLPSHYGVITKVYCNVFNSESLSINSYLNASEKYDKPSSGVFDCKIKNEKSTEKSEIAKFEIK